MRVFILATSSVALALGEADHADSEEYLSLLQLSAKPHSVDDLQLPVVGFEYPLGEAVSYGPDGTWATPYCKNIQGCTVAERVCPAGCNGAAFWETVPYPNSRLGVPAAPASRNAHYGGCITGRNIGGAYGSSPIGKWGVQTQQNCLNGPDSDKPGFFSVDVAWVTEHFAISAPWDITQTGYQHEFCPADCVNDCAMFKNGLFKACGSTAGLGWTGYNGATTNAVGPNPKCPLGKMHRDRGIASFTWCGEPTTTTTTTPPPPPVEEPVDEEADDEAGAEGDPHMTTDTGRRFDLE
jgi:hypothetical protein